jgi:hypothetical protein
MILNAQTRGGGEVRPEAPLPVVKPTIVIAWRSESGFWTKGVFWRVLIFGQKFGYQSREFWLSMYKSIAVKNNITRFKLGIKVSKYIWRLGQGCDYTSITLLILTGEV